MSIARSTRARAPRREVRRLAAASLTFLCGLSAASAASAAPTVVTLEFDDGMANSYTARAILASKNMKATFFVNSGRLDTNNYLTTAQLHDLANDGHEIGGHTLTHLDVPTLPYDEALAQICDDRAALVAKGFMVSNFAFPFGNLDATSEAIVAGCGYDSGRDIGGLVEPTGCIGCAFAETLPPKDPYATRSHSSILTGTSLAQMKGYVTQAEQNGGGWVQIVFHHVCDACNNYSVTAANLTALVDWLAVERSAGRVAVKTVRAALAAQAPPLLPPLVPLFLPPSFFNLLKNASLEADADTNGTADCWDHGAWGNNTATWSRPAGGHTGLAERVELTKHKSGDRKLLSRQDSGACAPKVAAGRVYTVGAWYKATAGARFVAYYRNGNGTWTWWQQSANLALKSDWTKATWKLPPVPPGVSHISVGLELPSLGALSIDDLSLIDTTP